MTLIFTIANWNTYYHTPTKILLTFNPAATMQCLKNYSPRLFPIVFNGIERTPHKFTVFLLLIVQAHYVATRFFMPSSSSFVNAVEKSKTYRRPRKNQKGKKRITPCRGQQRWRSKGRWLYNNQHKTIKTYRRSHKNRKGKKRIMAVRTKPWGGNKDGWARESEPMREKTKTAS